MAKTTGRQTSGKMGVRSLAQKRDEARYGFRSHPASHKVMGASGEEPDARAGRPPKSAKTSHAGKHAALGSMKSRWRR